MRRLIAIWVGKLLSVVGHMAGKKSSASPGAVALKICPSILKDINRIVNKKIIVTCGTNGKTTTNNLICSALEAKGFSVLCNRLGANMTSGIAAAYVQAADRLGRINVDYACLEVDEAYTPIVFSQIKPDIMIITNLFRDQLDRYGEIDITADILKKAIAKTNGVKLVLNADDPLCVQFARCGGTDAVYYGISEKVMPQTDDTKEGRFCPICGEELDFEFYHYSQLGNFHCRGCGYERPRPDFDIRNVSLSSPMSFTINGQRLEINYKGFYNIYNIAAVYAALDAAGLDTSDFESLLENYKPQIGRMQEFKFRKPVILSLSKNPAGFNQAIAAVNTDERKKDVIVAINDLANDGRDVSWLWDVDFDRLKNDKLNVIITAGIRKYDMSLRFKYSDMDVAMIAPDIKRALIEALSTESEVVYVLVNYTALYPTEAVLNELKREGQ